MLFLRVSYTTLEHYIPFIVGLVAQCSQYSCLIDCTGPFSPGPSSMQSVRGANSVLPPILLGLCQIHIVPLPLQNIFSGQIGLYFC